VELVLATARGRARRPLVISSDRGRGKTSALGIAAGRLLSEEARRVLVTAPHPASVEPLFARAAEILGRPPARAPGPLRLEHAGGLIAFLPPDALVADAPAADLLLVDEAAGIAGPLLARLLALYPRAVFATTVHGYEGTGRGFELRFRRTLDQETPGWRGFGLTTPVRWAPGDPLERATARLLLLDAAPSPDGLVAAAWPGTTRVERLGRDALAADEATLRALFGLLVLAHYQTRPLDLRHLLDGPNLRVYALRIAGAVAATALVAREGRLDPALCQAVFEGRRRPRGHLLPQTLSCHGGLREAPRLAWDRVVRIAVHPAARRRGLARHLLDGITAEARRDGVDLLGASFGAEAALLEFWAACGLHPAHMGTSRNAASGAQGMVVLKALGPGGEALAAQARRRLGERLPVLLAGPLRDLPTELAGRLLAACPPLEPGLEAELAGFAHASRPFEGSLPPLTGLVRAGLGPALRAGRLTPPQRDALIGVVLQHRDWRQVAALTGTAGRAGVLALLREAAAVLLAAGGAAD
jgi:tRNA(Met) cytidine acetyltransferase